MPEILITPAAVGKPIAPSVRLRLPGVPFFAVLCPASRTVACAAGSCAASIAEKLARITGPLKEGRPLMMVDSGNPKNTRAAEPRILLASDSAHQGGSMRRLLERAGFQVEYAGDYSRLDRALQAQDFDAILLEVTGEHAVEAAVAAALRVKRTNARQFVGYLADPTLHSSGLAGDGIFPRSAARLSSALRALLACDGGIDS